VVSRQQRVALEEVEGRLIDAGVRQVELRPWSKQEVGGLPCVRIGVLPAVYFHTVYKQPSFDDKTFRFVLERYDDQCYLGRAQFDFRSFAALFPTFKRPRTLRVRTEKPAMSESDSAARSDSAANRRPPERPTARPACAGPGDPTASSRPGGSGRAGQDPCCVRPCSRMLPACSAVRL
jgi:hypothetical protein